jgi:hypothetical protein
MAGSRSTPEEQKLTLPAGHPQSAYVSPDLSFRDPPDTVLPDEEAEILEEQQAAQEEEAQAAAEHEDKVAREEQAEALKATTKDEPKTAAASSAPKS